MEERQLRAELRPYGLEDGGQVPHVGGGVPGLHDGPQPPATADTTRRLVVVALSAARARRGDAVHRVQAGDPGLDADGAVTQGQVGAYRVEQFWYVAAGGVSVGQGAGTTRAAEELVQGHSGVLGLDVPQLGVDGRDRRHGHGAAPPVRTAVEVLPGVLDAGGVLPQEEGYDVIVEVGAYGQFAAVERGVAETGDTVLGGDAQGDEVPSGTGHVDFGGLDTHEGSPLVCGSLRLFRVRSFGFRRGGTAVRMRCAPDAVVVVDRTRSWKGCSGGRVPVPLGAGVGCRWAAGVWGGRAGARVSVCGPGRPVWSGSRRRCVRPAGSRRSACPPRPSPAVPGPRTVTPPGRRACSAPLWQ